MKPSHLPGWLIAIGALTGCAGPRPTMPAPYTVVLSADAKVNPDMEHRPTPVQVRLLELKNSSNFESLDFYTLYDKDEATLGTDLLSKEQLTLQPGQSVTLLRKAKTDARMLGVFVAFKDVTKGSWRAITPLPQAKELGRFSIFNPSFDTTYVTVKIGPQSVTATTTGKNVPVPIPGSGGLPQVNTPSIPNLPSGISLPSIPSPYR
jgi:type VI secretion system protein VasD